MGFPVICTTQIAQEYDLLPLLWNKLQQEEVPVWMWGSARAPTLSEFVLYFHSSGRYLFLPFDPVHVERPLTDRCLGLIWIDEYVTGQHARAHVYFFREHRRRRDLNLTIPCRAVAQQLADPPFNLKALYFFTDSRARLLQNFARRIGVEYVAEFPHYYPGANARVGYLDLLKER